MPAPLTALAGLYISGLIFFTVQNEIKEKKISQQVLAGKGTRSGRTQSESVKHNANSNAQI